LVGEASDKLAEDNFNSTGSHTSLDDLEQEFAIELKALAGGPTNSFELNPFIRRREASTVSH